MKGCQVKILKVRLLQRTDVHSGSRLALLGDSVHSVQAAALHFWNCFRQQNVSGLGRGSQFSSGNHHHLPHGQYAHKVYLGKLFTLIKGVSSTEKNNQTASQSSKKSTKKKDYKAFTKDTYPGSSKKYFLELSFGPFMKAPKISHT